jgi:hypothetical protein
MRSAVLIFLSLAIAAPAQAQKLILRKTLFGGEKKNLVEYLKLQGDLRLRHETFNKRTAPNGARQRQRIRFRIESEVGLPHSVAVNMRLAAGGGSQVSTNQSFDNLGSGKGIVIDRAYLRWAPSVGAQGEFRVAAGKMSNPLWRPYSYDLLYDTDFNPEGFSQATSFKTSFGRVFAGAMQVVVDEDSSSSSADQWLIAQQAGFEVAMGASKLRFAGGLHHWLNERTSTFGAVTVQEGNRRDGVGNLLNEFSIVNLSAQAVMNIGRVPVAVDGTFIKNTAAFNFMPRANVGYQAGWVAGKAKKAKTWEAAYYFKWLETDAAIADVVDSDWGDGGTNRRGHIMWAAYSPLDWMKLRAKYFLTAVIHESLAPGADDINRFQLDLEVKF